MRTLAGATPLPVLDNPVNLASFSATQVSGQETIQLTWAYGAGGWPARNIVVTMHSVVGGTPTQIAEFRVPKHKTEPNTLLVAAPSGLTYRFQAAAENTEGFSSFTTSSDVTIADTTYAITVTDDPVTPSTVSLNAQGFLHGLGDAISQHLTYLEDLSPKQWRMVYDPTSVTYAKANGISTTQVISDLWLPNHMDAVETTKFIAPWADFEVWEDYITGVVQTAIAEGWDPDYWDIFNEPDILTGRIRSADVATESDANWKETFRRAYFAIKAVDPAQKVIAPSSSDNEPVHNWQSSNQGVPWWDFLLYSRNHGIVWDAFSWHENLMQQLGDTWAVPYPAIERHMARGRDVMTLFPGTVANGTVLINEYQPQNVYLSGGHAVAYLKYMEDSQVEEANRTVWSDDYRDNLGGLLNSGSPRAIYWVHNQYAYMEGLTRMATATGKPFQLTCLAAKDDTDEVVRMLVGRHWTNNQATPIDSARDVTVSVEWPYAGSPWVAVQRLPRGTGTLVEPVTVSSAVQAPSGGVVTATIPAMEDCDAALVFASAEMLVEPPALDEPLAGYTGWWDASDTATITHTSGAVTQWNDKSGNNFHLTNGYGVGTRPITGTRTINGMNVLDFDKTNGTGFDYLDNQTGPLIDSETTIFIVLEHDAILTTAQTIIYADAGASHYYLFVETIANGAKASMWCGGFVPAGPTAETAGTPTVLTVKYDHTNTVIYKDGVGGTVSNPGQVASSGILLGCVTGSGATPWDGKIAEVIVYPTVLNNTDRAAIEGYLTNKWLTTTVPPYPSTTRYPSTTSYPEDP
jgi:hypothetical protein